MLSLLMSMRILVVEDEKTIRQTLSLNLEMEGYQVFQADDGGKALKILDEKSIDLLVLDWMLPGLDGLSVLRKVRQTNAQIGIIMLTARNHFQDKVDALKSGVDDYVEKPFHLGELLLRIKNLLARLTPKESHLNFIEFSGNTVDFDTLKILNTKGQQFEMSAKEAHLLKLLIENKNKVTSRKEILDVVWKYGSFPSTRTIDNYIVNFRKYFETNPKKPLHFHSVRGIGYRFTDQ